MRLPVELTALIKLSVKEVADISEFITVCEEIIDCSWGRKNSLTRTKSFCRRDDEPAKERKTLKRGSL